MAAGGNVRPYLPLGEESFIVLFGSGETSMSSTDGRTLEVQWESGDLVSTPLGLTRQHRAHEETRLLWVRNVALDRALGYEDFAGLEATVPDRFPSLAEVRH
jgi:hypothetical protein